MSYTYTCYECRGTFDGRGVFPPGNKLSDYCPHCPTCALIKQQSHQFQEQQRYQNLYYQEEETDRYEQQNTRRSVYNTTYNEAPVLVSPPPFPAPRPAQSPTPAKSKPVVIEKPTFWDNISPIFLCCGVFWISFLKATIMTAFIGDFSQPLRGILVDYSATIFFTYLGIKIFWGAIKTIENIF